MNIDFWRKLYKKTTHDFEKYVKNAGPMLVAFNTNIDAIKYVNSSFMKMIDIGSYTQKKDNGIINNLDDFSTGLLFSMRYGKSVEWVIKDIKTYNYLKDNSKFDSSRMGGQSGIISNYLKNIGFRKVIVFNQSLSGEEAKYYNRSIMIPKIENNRLVFKKACDSGNPKTETKMNLIYEFRKGMKIQTKDTSFTVPRQNRFIVSHRPKKKPPCFQKGFEPHFRQLFSGIDRVFLSGINIEPEEKNSYYRTISSQILKIKSTNKDIKIHYEFTSEESPNIIRNIIENILKNVDSLGCNERELCILLENIGKRKIAKDIKDMDYSALSLLSGTRAVMKHLDMKRVHVHNMNYFICITSKDYKISPKRIRCCLLYAAEAVVTKSIRQYLHHANDIELNLKYSISRKGIDEIKEISQSLGKDISEGFLELKGYNINIVPTKLAEHVKTTVGLGDIISSTAFFGEIFRK